MAHVICKLCKATGTSKCPSCRNVFPDNQTDAMLSMNFKHKLLKYDPTQPGSRELQINFTYYLPSEFDSNDKPRIKPMTDLEIHATALRYMFELLNSNINADSNAAPNNERFGQLSFTQLACNHVWVFAPGEHSDIGCGHT